MKNLVLPMVLAASFTVSAMTSCTKKVHPVAAVTPREVVGLLQNGFAVLIDVREPDEVKDTGMAGPAVAAPFSRIEANAPEWREFVAKLPRDKQVIFYCASGGRAGKAAELLAREGFRTGNMGGFDDWEKAGLPVKK